MFRIRVLQWCIQQYVIQLYYYFGLAAWIIGSLGQRLQGKPAHKNTKRIKTH